VPSAYDRLPLGSLRVFEAVAAHLSFSEAADALNVTPAAVSQQIKTLEAYIQVPLFRRSGRRVEITEEGLELLPAVRSGLEKLESALQQMKHHRRAGPLQISLLSSFLQIWLLPRIRSLVDFSRSENHVAIRFGRGDYPNMHSEKLLDDWLVPVASPDLIKQHGMIERGEALSKFPLLESGDEPWHVWAQASEQEAWHSRSPSIEDSAGLLAAAEEGLGYALGRWTLVSRALQKGTLKLAGRGALAYGSAYWFVCPKSFLALPKVALFREWILAAAKAFPAPPE
jgi:LysR family transcriptional regulator, glycine cleavage system transcriptional activator